VGVSEVLTLKRLAPRNSNLRSKTIINAHKTHQKVDEIEEKKNGE
jgi:hypothetical protein